MSPAVDPEEFPFADAPEQLTPIEALAPQAPQAQEPPPYRQHAGSTQVWSFDKRKDEGSWREIANFTARILNEVTLVTDTDSLRVFEIEAVLQGGRKVRCTVPADKFGDMRWVLTELGADACIAAGREATSRMRAAIQFFSQPVPRSTSYAHLGWTKLEDGRWVFLTASGGLGRDGLVEGVTTELDPVLDRYSLPGTFRPETISDALGLLEVGGEGDEKLGVAGLGYVLRTVMGEPGESVPTILNLIGPTGSRKTAVASVLQRFFGSSMSAERLPGSWSSTAMGLTALLAGAADCAVVIDDYAPSSEGRERMEAVLEAVVRGGSNGAARLRALQTGGRAAVRVPKGSVISTGEDLAGQHSIRARCVTVEIEKDSLNLKALSAVQAAAANGRLAECLAGLVMWLASDFDKLRADFAALVEKLIPTYSGIPGAHSRVPAAFAQLEAAWQLFIRFAVAVGAIDMTEGAVLEHRVRTALLELAAIQSDGLAEVTPVERFLSLVNSALGAGEAHVADAQTGGAPSDGTRWGWLNDSAFFAGKPSGRCIGWTEGEHLFLDPTVSLSVVNRLAGPGRGVSLSETTLAKALKAAGHLSTTEEATRGTLKVRKRCAGAQRSVLHLSVGVLDGPVAAPVAEAAAA